MTRSADFFRAAETAAAVLREARIRTFPVPLKQVLRRCGVRLLPYRDFCREEGCTEEDCFSWFGKDASSIRCGTRFLILYNEKRSPALRIRFSVAHELGHILLGHHAETDEEKRFDRELYELQEEEARLKSQDLTLVHVRLSCLQGSQRRDADRPAEPHEAFRPGVLAAQ